jgi:glycosyltransferase involved in cell wall biosynthesis
MRIGVLVPGPVPYGFGGSERVGRGLATWITAHTAHDAEVVIPPSPEQDLPALLASYEAWSLLDVGRFDLVVSTKYPSWMVDHPRHVVHLQHALRGLYDTYPVHEPRRVAATDARFEPLLAAVRRPPERGALADVFGHWRTLLAAVGPDHPLLRFPGPLAREVVHFLDAVGLDARRVRAHFGISANVTYRRSYFPAGTDPQVLVPPTDLEGLHGGAFDYFFTASRLDHPKRLDLLVRAHRHVPGDVRLRIAGTGPQEDALRALAAGDPRVELLGHVTDAQLVDLYADALAVPFIPLDEDLGLITIEAQMSGKAVVTCRDSGGPPELLVDGLDGLVTVPTEEAIAAALTTLVEHPDTARRLGEHGRLRARRFTWAAVAQRILEGSERERPVARRPGRPKLVVTTTFPLTPAVGGGQLRAFNLYRALTGTYDVEVVSMAPMDHSASRVVHAPGFVTTVVPKSDRHDRREREIEMRARIPITDVVASALVPLTPEFGEALRRALADATAAVAAEPYLVGAVIAASPDTPLVYDAYNAELRLKEAVLPDGPAREPLLEIVARLEGEVFTRARLVTVCSTDDADALCEAYGARATVHIANGVDLAAIPYVTGDDRTRASRAWRLAFSRLHRRSSDIRALAVFMGSWHPPNLDAVESIIRYAEALPDVGFLVGGSVGIQFRTRPLPPNLMLLGVVSDDAKRALLSAADVALNPMTRGSGTNLKVVEYFAAGVPTISTATGVRGLGVVDGREATLVDAGGFPAAIRAALDDRVAAAARARRARALAEDYDWRLLGARMVASLESALAPAGGASEPGIQGAADLHSPHRRR